MLNSCDIHIHTYVRQKGRQMKEHARENVNDGIACCMQMCIYKFDLFYICMYVHMNVNIQQYICMFVCIDFYICKLYTNAHRYI